MRPREGGEEVIQRYFVGNVYGSELKAPLVSVTVKKVIVPNGDVEKISWGNSGRILVVVFCSRRRNAYQVRSKLVRRTG